MPSKQYVEHIVSLVNFATNRVAEADNKVLLEANRVIFDEWFEKAPGYEAAVAAISADVVKREVLSQLGNGYAVDDHRFAKVAGSIADWLIVKGYRPVRRNQSYNYAPPPTVHVDMLTAACITSEKRYWDPLFEPTKTLLDALRAAVTQAEIDVAVDVFVLALR